MAAVGCFDVFSPLRISAMTKPDFNGTWALDHQASSSLEPLMQKIGADFLERKLAAVAPLKATFHQSEDVVTVATRAPGFSLDEILYLDGRSHPTNIALLGGTTLKSSAVWSKDYQQLISTYQIKTKQGEEGELIIKRRLINGMKSEGVIFTLKLNGQPDEISASQIWNKQG
ncbi:MAG TPA: hypothetical protein VK673_07590 [Chthoniobacterales bacterium]|nr:hypothetical protein [Chthoniobacterales bacterium]